MQAWQARWLAKYYATNDETLIVLGKAFEPSWKVALVATAPVMMFLVVVGLAMDSIVPVIGLVSMLAVTSQFSREASPCVFAVEKDAIVLGWYAGLGRRGTRRIALSEIDHVQRNYGMVPCSLRFETRAKAQHTLHFYAHFSKHRYKRPQFSVFLNRTEVSLPMGEPDKVAELFEATCGVLSKAGVLVRDW